MNPVEEFLNMEKTALSPATQSALTMGAITAGTTALAAVGAAQLQQGIQSAADAVSRSLAYKRMLNGNPELRKMDGKKTRRYFDTMYRMAPEVARDPLASGSWVRSVHDFGMDYVNPQALQTLAATGDRLRAREERGMIDPYGLASAAAQAGVSEYGRYQGMEMDRQRQQLERDKLRWQKGKDIADLVLKVPGALAKGQEVVSPVRSNKKRNKKRR